MPEMFDPDGTLDLHLPPIVDSSELADKANLSGLPQDEAVVHPDLQPDKAEQGEHRVNHDGESSGYWIPMPAPPRPTVETVWHYTDAAGAIGVISSGEVWATSINSLNDSEEFAYGIQLLEEQLSLVQQSRHVHPTQKSFMENAVQLAKSSTEVEPLYVFCASEAADSLSQWRAYGGEVSYAVGLQVDREIMAIVVEGQEPRTLPWRGPWPTWGKVLYDLDDQRDLLLRGLSFCAAAAPGPEEEEDLPGLSVHQASGVLIGLSIYCKHDAFRDEREVRVVTSAPDDDSAVRFRPSRFGVTPYVRLAQPPERDLSKGAYWTVPEHPRLPIGGVCVGPTPHSKTASQGMRQLLDSNEHRGVLIAESTAPFR